MIPNSGVPLLDLQAQYAPLRDDVLQVITRVCDSQRFVMGPEVDAFEREIAALVGVSHAVSVSSGTDALLLALMALGVGHGDEVITTTYSFFATAGVIARVGARPVLIDIDPVTYNIDVSRVEAAITPRTKAIMPVHLYGQCADMQPLLDISTRTGIPIVEDAAQAIGATWWGRQAGSIGAFGCFSFFPSKNLGAFGDGGLVTTNDPALAKRAALMRNHGMEPKYYHHMIGGNFRMDALQAAVLRVKAPHLAAWTEGRRRNAARYATLFAGAGLASHVVLPVEAVGCRHIYNQFVVRVPRRNALKEFLDHHRIGNEVYYPVPFHLQPCFTDLGYRHGDFPHAEAAAEQTIAIPVFSELTEAQQATVVAAIAEFLGRGDEAGSAPTA